MGITYREIYQGEEKNVFHLIMDVFSEFVAPGYSEDGIIEFSRYVTPKSTRDRLSQNHFILLALDGSSIVGAIEVRNDNHISLFFVRKEYQYQGIGKKLNELAIGRCKTLKPNVDIIDVHSSSYAVPIYEKLGFAKVSDEQIVNGMRFTPMLFKL